jgi:hypothetical protein
MAKIRVEVIYDTSGHISILLEDIYNSSYYLIDRWEPAERYWSKEPIPVSFMGKLLKHGFYIEADPEEISREWGAYWEATSSSAGVFGENCAVAAQRFLSHFANIPKPSIFSISWKYLDLYIQWPSFIPLPITLPGRIFSNVKFYTKGKIFACHSIADLPDDIENACLKRSIKFLKHQDNIGADSLLKLKTLVEFYDELNALCAQADLMMNEGQIKTGNCVRKLVGDLEESAKAYMVDSEDNAFSTFKSRCEMCLNSAVPKLEAHQHCKFILANVALMILGAGILYLIAASINKATTGKFFLYNTPHSNKIIDIMNSLSLSEERYKAISLKSLSQDLSTSKQKKVPWSIATHVGYLRAYAPKLVTCIILIIPARYGPS